MKLTDSASETIKSPVDRTEGIEIPIDGHLRTTYLKVSHKPNESWFEISLNIHTCEDYKLKIKRIRLFIDNKCRL